MNRWMWKKFEITRRLREQKQAVEVYREVEVCRWTERANSFAICGRQSPTTTSFHSPSIGYFKWGEAADRPIALCIKCNNVDELFNVAEPFGAGTLDDHDDWRWQQQSSSSRWAPRNEWNRRHCLCSPQENLDRYIIFCRHLQVPPSSSAASISTAADPCCK